VVTCVRLQLASAAGAPPTATIISAGHDGVLRTWGLEPGSTTESGAGGASPLRMIGSRKIHAISAIEGLHLRSAALAPTRASSRAESPELVTGFQVRTMQTEAQERAKRVIEKVWAA